MTCEYHDKTGKIKNCNRQPIFQAGGLQDLTAQKSVILALSIQDNISGTEYSFFLSAFVNRFSPFLIHLRIIQSAISNLTRVLNGQSAGAQEYAQHVALISYIGLGALQHKVHNPQLYFGISRQIRALLGKLICSSLSADIVVARCLGALFFLANPNSKDVADLSEMEAVCTRMSRTELSCMDTSTKCTHAYVGFFFLVLHCWDGMSTFIQSFVLNTLQQQVPNFMNSFSLANILMQDEGQVNLLDHEVSIVQELLVQGSNVGEGFGFCLSLCWPHVIKKALFSSELANDQRADALAEIGHLISVSMLHFFGKSQTILQLYIHISNVFRDLLSQDHTVAERSLSSLVSFVTEDWAVLRGFLIYPKPLHLLHMLCVAFSELDMHDEYQTFLQALKAAATNYDSFHFPESCPLSWHGLCEDLECKSAWKLFYF